jgi:uncharacterized protein YpmB
LNPAIRQAGESLENYFRKQRGVSLQRGKSWALWENTFISDHQRVSIPAKNFREGKWEAKRCRRISLLDSSLAVP